jgi:hypothetical protein
LIKKSIIPRIAGLFAGYIVIFFALVLLQFTKYGNFTKRTGGLTVSGQYKAKTAEVPLGFEWQAITGKATVLFNGMEYRLTAENDFTLVYANGERDIKLPEYITVYGNGVAFRFEEGTTLIFTTQKSEGGQELTISANFAKSTASIELPYRLLGASRIQQGEDGEFFIFYNGMKYSFSNQLTNHGKQIIILTNSIPFIARQIIDTAAGQSPAARPPSAAVPPAAGQPPPAAERDEQAFNPADFVIAGAETVAGYNNAVEQWRMRASSQWLLSPDEVQVMAYTAEAIRRGSYRQAIAAVPSSFVNSAINDVQKTFASSPYFGRLDQGLRSLSAFERDTNNRLSAEISGKSLDFFKESRAIEYLSVRGLASLVDAAGTWAHSIDISAITPDFIPAILENYLDWAEYHPNTENPFVRFNDRVYSLVSAGIRKNSQGDKVFVFNNGSADMLFNLRLGKALMLYAENTGNADWAAAARSVILSVLSMTNNGGDVPKELLVSDLTADHPLSVESSTTINSAYLYRELGIGENFAHAAGMNAINRSLWVWTAATQISASPINGAAGLDISVTFPAGEAHYMLIRNIPAFRRLQLYNIDYRTAPDFERYDSPGWSYSTSEQTLLVKMKHKTPVEHIRIFW